MRYVFLSLFTIAHAIFTLFLLFAVTAYGLGDGEIPVPHTAREELTHQIHLALFYVFGAPLVDITLAWGGRLFDGPLFYVVVFLNSALWASLIVALWLRFGPHRRCRARE